VKVGVRVSKKLKFELQVAGGEEGKQDLYYYPIYI
jgi:hypothetical protein